MNPSEPGPGRSPFDRSPQRRDRQRSDAQRSDRQRSDEDERHLGDWRARRARAGVVLGPPRYGRYVGLLALVILVLVTISIVLTKPHGVGGVAIGHRIPPFAAPLASGDLTERGVNVATHANENGAGAPPACQVRGAGVLNVCELYERGPLVLALFVDDGSCAKILDDMQALAHEFPGVSFAAVAIKGERDPLRRLISTRRLDSVQVGLDPEGVLVDLYGVASCPQVSFVLPGGVVQSAAMLDRPPLSGLRARVSELVADARARGWRPSP
jgi:hypothetical protein